MIKLVAFDWNGTLLADTLPTVYVDNQVLKMLGSRRRLSLREYQNNFCIPINKYFENLGFSKKFFARNAKKIFSLFYKFYEPLEKKCRTRGGVKKSLAWLKKSKTAAIIYSNHFALHIEKQTARLKINQYFAKIIGRPLNDSSHLRNQGKIAWLQDYVKKNKLMPREVITVGDTTEEIEIGRALGLYTVAISGGYNSTSRLKRAKPDFLIHNMNELPGIVKKLNN